MLTHTISPPMRTAHVASLQTEPHSVDESIYTGLEQVGFGVLMLSAQGVVLSANGLARKALADGRFICVDGDRLSSPQTVNSKVLDVAVAMAASGRVQLVNLSEGEAHMRLTCMSVGDHPGAANQLASDAGLNPGPVLPKPVMVMLYPVADASVHRTAGQLSV